MSKGKLTWAAFGLVLGILSGAIGAAGANKWYPGLTRFEEIEAQKIRIVNAAGKTVAELSAETSGGWLSIHDVAGQTLANLGAMPQGGFLSINNALGEGVADLRADLQGGGGLTINDAAGEFALRLSVFPGRGGALDIYNAPGKTVAKLSAYPEGGTLEIYNAAHRVVASLTGDSASGGGLRIRNNKAPFPVAILEAGPDGSGVLTISNAASLPVVKLP